MNRGDIYRVAERLPERGDKPGFYVVVSRSFVCASDRLAHVVCAPVYSQRLGISTEVMVGPEEGVPRPSAARCDYLTLIPKSRLSVFAGRLGPERVADLNVALAEAVGIV